MTLMDAKEEDPKIIQRRKRLVRAAILVVVLGVFGCLFWFFPVIPFLYRYYSEERVVNKFFEAIESKDFDAAYGIYNADPDWKSHPEKYKDYTQNQFLLDWGPSGEYGVITSHEIDCVKEPDKKGFTSPSGVIIAVRVNNRTDDTSMWVEKKSKTLTTSPFPLLCHPPK